MLYDCPSGAEDATSTPHDTGSTLRGLRICEAAKDQDCEN
jgi:hypothetical protein